MDKPYSSYSLEELASDAGFREWVLEPNSDNAAFWQDFIHKHPDKAPLIDEARALVQGVHIYFDKEATDLRKLSQYFDEVTRRVDMEKDQASSTPIIRVYPYRKLAVAASFILLMGILGWFWVSQHNSYQTYTTAYGEWETVNLPDGSTVKLNANSELRLATSWKEGKDRKVWLKGEAFFEVEKKPATGAKFYVITHDVSVEVLGTSFNVNSRGEKTEVFLEEGKIKLETSKEETLMDPGDFIAYSAAKQQIIEKRNNVNDLRSSWKDGTLILQSKSVREIFSKIEEIYGVEIQVDDTQLLDSKTTVRIPMDKLEIALPILEKTLGKELSQDGNRLIVN